MFIDHLNRTSSPLRPRIAPRCSAAVACSGTLVLISIAAGPAAAQVGYVFNGGGTQVLPDGNYSTVYNMGPGTLIINDGSTIAAAVNLSNGTLEINGSTFTGSFLSPHFAAIQGGGPFAGNGTINIRGGHINGPIFELGGLVNIWGGLINGTIFNEDGSPGPFGLSTQGVNIYGSGFTAPGFVANASDGANVFGTYWQLGGTLTDGNALTTMFWNVHANTGPHGLNLINAPTAPEPGSLALYAFGAMAAAGGAAVRGRARRK